MQAHNYEVTDPIAGFEEGDVLDVTSRFGDWHTYELKLEVNPTVPGRRTVVVTGEESGFSEAEILDETARFGDWYEYDLQFDPAGSSVETTPSGQIRLTKNELERIAKPASPSA